MASVSSVLVKNDDEPSGESSSNNYLQSYVKNLKNIYNK